MSTYAIDIIDDEESIREGISAVLEPVYRVRTFPTAEAALEVIRALPPDLVLLDIGLPGMSGLDALRVIKEFSPGILVIVITAYEDVKSVVAAMKGGAHDYVVKPLYMDTLEVNIRNALESLRLKKEVQELQEKYLRENITCFIGESDSIQDVMEFVGKLAASPDTPILLVGETGTGKELVASAIHYRSPNFRGPLISVNCAAIPKELIESELFGYERGAFSGAKSAGKKGLVEEAAGGTLFLDEVGDMSLEAQAKLLRFLEEGEFYRVGGTRKQHVHTRVVSATNKDLGALIEKGLFREDLYFRLAVAKVMVPSLNDRRDDIIPLARYFLVDFNKRFKKSFTGIAPDAEAVLKSRQWRGNVRELKNLIERAALTGGGPEITLSDLGLTAGAADGEMIPRRRKDDGPLVPPSGVDFSAIAEDLERQYFSVALEMSGGNESRAAQLLNINHHTFRYRKKKLNL